VTGRPIDAAVLLEVGLAALAAAAAAMVAQARGETTLRRVVALRRWSMGSGLALALAAASGVLLGADHLGSPADLVTTGYGRIVLGEAALLAGAAGLWLLNHRYNLPLAERTLTSVRRVSWSQLLVAGAAAGTAGLLAVVTPPVGSAWAGRVDGGLTLVGSDPGQTAAAEVGIDPGFPGVNTFAVRLTGFRHHRPLAAPGLRLRFEFLDRPGPGPSSDLPLSPSGPRGLYRAVGANLAADGRWRITVTGPAGSGSGSGRVEIPLETVPRCSVRGLPGGSGGITTRADVPEIGALRGSVTPGRPGPNEIRAALVDPQGRALAFDGTPTVRISTTGHEPLALSDVRQPGPGEAVVTTGLTAGPWRVDLAGTAGGRPIRGCFEAVIPAGAPGPGRR
jgi:hypothetical protein